MNKKTGSEKIRLMLVLVAALLGAALALPAAAAPKRLGAVREVRAGGAYVELVCEAGRVRISQRGPGLLHILATDAAEFSPLPSFALAPGGAAETTLQRKKEDDQELVLTTGPLTLVIHKASGRMDVLDAAGHGIVTEPADAGVFFDGNTVGCVKASPADEHYYGFGEKTGPLDKRGMKMAMWNSDNVYGLNSDPLYQSHPIFLAVSQARAWGLFFDNTFRTEFDMAKTRSDRFQISAKAGELNYWVMAGPAPKDVLSQYGELVGRMPLPPAWGIGYHQCRYSYKTADVVRDLRDNFIKREIPCDAIYLDIHYMNDFRVFTFNPQRFPDPAGLVAELKRDGIRTVVIVDPGIKIDPDYPPYVQGMQNGYFVLDQEGKPFTAYVWPRAVHFPDFYQPAVRDWWGGLLKFYTDLGVAGLWCDMNEPAGWKREIRPLPDLPVPLGLPEWERMRHGKAPQPILPHDQVHNVYASLEIQGTYDGLRKLRPAERPFLISRAGYSGIQRQTLIWTGDNSSTWGHLEMCLPLLLNMGLSGLTFVGSDVGGFVGSPSAEMFARWIQQGVFYPFCRTHTAIYMPDQEPWSYGPEVEKISREAIKFRYRLMPYTYSLFEVSTRLNWPVMRAMIFEFPQDPAVAGVQDQFMLGEFLLAAPVIEKGRDKRAVYFPKGKWYDWETRKEYQGPAHFEVDAPLNHIPLFAREGAIIPMGPDLQHTGEKPCDPLTVSVFPGPAPSSFELYEDDGESMAYAEGASARTMFRAAPTADGVEIKIEARVGVFDPRRAKLVLQVYNVSDQAQVKVLAASGQEMTAAALATYDHAAKVWLITLPGDAAARTVKFITR